MDAIITEKEREEIRLSFGALLRKKREKIGISQEELAFRSGLDRTYVGSVERGERNLPIENIYILGKALKCGPRKLLPKF